jgi:hypothetical protein
MPITYVPNDPLASGGPATASVSPRAKPTGSAGFDIRPSAPSAVYAPHSEGFDYWQSRNALYLGLAAWRDVAGGPAGPWYGNRSTLPVLTDAGDDLNAFYDRRGLQFFHHSFGGKMVHSAESVDVVCHEEGHALLDSIRSDFFDVPFIEVGALHEAFGDCMAIISGLSDSRVRAALIATSADLSGHHFLESLAEELGDAIKREYGATSSESGALRHALNTFRWADPTNLPPNGPASVLSAEVHSFSRVFSGAFWDTLRGIQAAGPHTVTGLRNAVRTTGKLLISALRAVPAAPRTFEGVGRRMAEADASNNGGANVAIIRAAFAAHGISVPAPALPMAVPIKGGRTRGAASRQLRGQLEVPSGARMSYTNVTSDSHGQMAHVTAYRPIALTDELAGLHMLVPASAQVRTRGAAVVGVLGEVRPADQEAENEARAFARALVANGDLIFPAGDPPAGAPRTRGPAAGGRLRGRAAAPLLPRPANAPFPPTHVVRREGNLNVIRRLGFA